MAEVVAASQTVDKSADQEQIFNSSNDSLSDEAESKDSTLVDESSLGQEDSAKSLTDDPEAKSQAKDDNANFPTGDHKNSKTNPISEAISPEGGSDRTHPKLTLSTSKSDIHHTSSSSLNSSNSASSHLLSTPVRQSSPVITGGNEGSITVEPIPQMTSTPIVAGTSQSSLAVPSTSTSRADRPQSLSVRLKTSERSDSCVEGEDEVNTSFTSQTSTHTTTHESQTDLDLYDQLQAPIVGYETMEERARFTVFKIRVQKSHDDGWHIFRRYSDFVRLNDTLKQVFPHFRLALPPKRWLGDNYERSFLDDRLLGLQAFLNNVLSHRDVCNSEPVREFLCIDDPPGAHDSLEESRAACEMLEDQVYTLRQDLTTRDARIALLEEELSLFKAEVENLRRALRVERALNTHRRCSPSSQSQRSENSITEHDEASEAEADQQGHQNEKPSTTSSVMTSPEGASTHSWDVISETSRDVRGSRDVTSEKLRDVRGGGDVTSEKPRDVRGGRDVTSAKVTSGTTLVTTSATTSPAVTTSTVTSSVTTSSVTVVTSVPGMTSLTMTHPLGPTLTPEKLRSATVP